MTTPGDHRKRRGDAPAVVMADGTTVTYDELDDRSMRLARRLHRHGLRPGGHVAILLENHPRYLEVYWAAIRSGLYVTPVSWELDIDEIGHVIDDCGATVLVTSTALRDVVSSLGARRLSRVTLRLVMDGELDGFTSYERAVAAQPAAPLDDEREGAAMFYSSGTTGRPKGIKPPLSGEPYGSRPNPLAAMLHAQWGFDRDAVHLCALPLHHNAGIGFAASVHRLGGTVVVMDRFEPRRVLELIEQHRVTHAQLAPVHLRRLLQLDPAERDAHDLSSLRVVVHAGAPCPVEVKARALQWLGPIVHEYYIGVEANGLTLVRPEEWLEHPGTVGRVLAGAVHVLGDDGAELPAGRPGVVWFDTGARFEYHDEPAKTAEAFHERGWSTLGDVGYLDDEGYLYLVDRAAHVVEVDGTTVYPQQVENVLLAHAAVADAAVLDIGDPEAGVHVKALVQLVAGVIPGEALASALLDHCRRRLPAPSVPRSLDFVGDIGRLQSGKLRKHVLRDRHPVGPTG